MRRGRAALFLLCTAAFMAVADTTIVSIALPSIRRELEFSGADAQWILNGYALAFGGLLLLCGRAGDLYGRRRLFLAGLAVFGAASLVGGLAPSPWVLIAARFLQGAGGAALVPASLSLLTTVFAEGEIRNRAIGAYGAMAALGFVVGMVGGGVITELLGWRWVMFVNVPVALAVFVLTPLAVPESRECGAGRRKPFPNASRLQRSIPLQSEKKPVQARASRAPETLVSAPVRARASSSPRCLPKCSAIPLA